jgi:thiamine monophosphate kinase
MRTDAISLAMSASVDFELLFTVRAEAVDRVLSLLGHHGLIAREIGEAVDEPTNSLAFSDGSIQMLPGVAWNQQTGDYLDEILRRERTA